MKTRAAIALAVVPMVVSLASAGWAQDRQGRSAQAAPVATVSEGELCSQGNAGACAAGKEKWIQLESCQMGTARRRGPWTCPVSEADAAQVDSLNALCQQGSTRDCAAFAAIVSRALYDWMKPSWDRR